MFKYTREAIEVLKEDFKRYSRVFKVGSLLFTSAYFVWALIAQTGIFAVNIVLASLFVSYTIFELVINATGHKGAKVFVKRTYKWITLGIRAFTLGSMLYGIYTATTNVSAMSTIIATLMIILWVFQILLEIVVEIIENKIDLFDKAIRQDVEDIKKSVMKPVTAVTNTLKKLTGREVEPEPEKHKKILKLDKRIQEREEIKAQEKTKKRSWFRRRVKE
jgi:hypothetical protein